MKQAIALALALIILLGGCAQQPSGGSTDTGGAAPPQTGTGSGAGEQPSGGSGAGTGAGTAQPSGETPIDETAPAVSAQSVISGTGGIAGIVATISGSKTVTILFAGRGNDENFVPPGKQDLNAQVDDKNKTQGADQNKSTGKGNAGKPELDLNALTALNITVGEISIHLSRAFGGNIDLNGTEDENNTIPDLNQNQDTNNSIPDLNQNQDQNNNIPDLNQGQDQNQNQDNNSNGDFNANFAAEDQNNSKAQNKWILLSSAEQTFDLLQLMSTEALLADTEIPAGKYTQIRLEIISATAIIDGNEFEVNVPPNKLMLHGVFDAEDGSVIFMGLDFDIDKSLHATGNGQLILRPTIKLKIFEDANSSV